MSLSYLQNRVNCLQRKMALPYAHLMFQQMCTDFCLEWARAQAEKRPTPSPQSFAIRVADAGFPLPTFSAVVRYLEKCRTSGEGPLPEDLLNALFPNFEYRPDVL